MRRSQRANPLRRAREIPAEVKTLKAQLPKPAEGQEAPSSPLTSQIAALEQARHCCLLCCRQSALLCLML